MSWRQHVGRPPRVAGEVKQKPCGGTFRDGEGEWRVCYLQERHAGAHQGPTVEEIEAGAAPDPGGEGDG